MRWGAGPRQQNDHADTVTLTLDAVFFSTGEMRRTRYNATLGPRHCRRRSAPGGRGDGPARRRGGIRCETDSGRR